MDPQRFSRDKSFCIIWSEGMIGLQSHCISSALSASVVPLDESYSGPPFAHVHVQVGCLLAWNLGLTSRVDFLLYLLWKNLSVVNFEDQY